jgi:hypothetical protein
LLRLAPCRAQGAAVTLLLLQAAPRRAAVEPHCTGLGGQRRWRPAGPIAEARAPRGGWARRRQWESRRCPALGPHAGFFLAHTCFFFSIWICRWK